MTWRAERDSGAGVFRCPLCGAPAIADPDQVPGRDRTRARILLCIGRNCGAVIVAVIMVDARLDKLDQEIKALARLSPRRN